MQRMMKSFVLWCEVEIDYAKMVLLRCIFNAWDGCNRSISLENSLINLANIYICVEKFSKHIIFLEKLSLTFEFSLLTFKMHNAGNSLNMHPIRYECESANLCKYPLIAYKRFHLHLNCIIFLLSFRTSIKCTNDYIELLMHIIAFYVTMQRWKIMRRAWHTRKKRIILVIHKVPIQWKNH